MNAPRFGSRQVPAEQLSDEELLAELTRYRQQRKALSGGGTSKGASSEPAPKKKLDAKRVRQFYANLELDEGASLEQVRTAYERLVQRYAPERHAGNPKKQALAAQLAKKLTEAYQGLAAHLGN